MKILIKVDSWVYQQPFAQPIREQVFIQEQAVPVAEEWDDMDAQSRHAIAWRPARHELDQAEVIGTARLLPSQLLTTLNERHSSIGRMAVLPQWRGRGVGRQLLQTLMAEARQRGDDVVNLHAQLHAVPFYQQAGFSIVGETFMEAGIAHVAMAYRNNR